MASPLLTKLAEKVRLATVEIHNLRRERDRLKAEVALMEEESRRARRFLRQHSDLQALQEKVRHRLEKIMTKLDQAAP